MTRTMPPTTDEQLLDAYESPEAKDVLFIGTWHRAADGTLTLTDRIPGLNALPEDQAVWFMSPFTPLK